jgi:hypothetical protein
MQRYRMNLETVKDQERISGRASPFCRVEEKVTRILLHFESKEIKGKNLCSKWPKINEDLAYKAVIHCIKLMSET